MKKYIRPGKNVDMDPFFLKLSHQMKIKNVLQMEKKFFDLFPSFGQTKVKDPEDLHRYFWYGCDLVRQCLRPRDSKPRREKVFNPAAKWMGSFVMSMNYLFHPRIQTDVSRLRSFMENKIEISRHSGLTLIYKRVTHFQFT